MKRIAQTDLNRLAARKIILELCKDDPKTILLMTEKVGLCDSYIKKHCDILREGGFLKRQIIYVGRFRTRSFLYTTVNENYTLEDVILKSTQLGYDYKEERPKKDEKQEKDYNPLGRIIKFEPKNSNDKEAIAISERYRTQQKMTRLAMKSSRNYISGSSLSDAV